MKAKMYNIVERALEEGLAYGVRRIFKHRDGPLTEERLLGLVDELVEYQMVVGLGEVIDWEECDK